MANTKKNGNDNNDVINEMEEITMMNENANDTMVNAMNDENVINFENEEETIEMTNENTNTNIMANVPVVKIEWIADPAARQVTEAQFKALGMKFEWIRPKVKTALVIDEATGLATCPVCGKTFNVDEYSVEMQKRAHASGLCQECIAQFDKLNGHMKHKATAKSVTGERMIVNGGMNAGERIRAAFKWAVDNNHIDEELLENFQDKQWTKDTLGLKYALLKDITNCSAEEIKVKQYEDNKNGKTNSRYISRTRYEINGRTFMITNDMYSKNLDQVNKAFHKLGLIDDDYEI